MKVAYRDTCALNQQPPTEARQHLRTQSQRRHHIKQGDRVNERGPLPQILAAALTAYALALVAVFAPATVYIAWRRHR